MVTHTIPKYQNLAFKTLLLSDQDMSSRVVENYVNGAPMPCWIQLLLVKKKKTTKKVDLPSANAAQHVGSSLAKQGPVPTRPRNTTGGAERAKKVSANTRSRLSILRLQLLSQMGVVDEERACYTLEYKRCERSLRSPALVMKVLQMHIL